MEITEIKRKGNSETYNVYVDGEFFALLEAEIIYKFKVKVGANFSYDVLKEIKLESDKLLCSIRAVNYVSKMLRTKKQVKDYLKKHNFEDEAIDLAIERLISYGYINDEYFAKISAESLSKTKGKKYIKNDLKAKGVSDESINVVLENMDDEFDTCREVIKKWLKGKSLPLQQKDRQKLYRFLFCRGFEFDTIKRALNSQNIDGEEESYF